MKMLLFGKTGLLGNALFDVFSPIHELIAPSHQECDITQSESIEKWLTKSSPEMVINATGYTAVDRAEQEKEKAFQINAHGVSQLAQSLAQKNIPLIHFSTDYVFDGKNPHGYRENDPPTPLSGYGFSKALGEAEIQKHGKKYYLIRTSWLFGPHGKNFVDSLLERIEKGEKEIRVVSDQRGCPTFTLDLAKAVFNLLQSAPYGIYHLVNEGSCTWYEFAKEIFAQLGIPQKIIPISSAELSRPAKRPSSSLLLNTKFTHLRPWRKALEAYLKEKTVIL